jgi:hypothetical protein
MIQDADKEFTIKKATIKRNVEWLLENYPNTRNNYNLLVQYYHFYIDGLKNFIPMEELMKMTQVESITRAFRELSSHPIFTCDDCKRRFKTAEIANKHAINFKHIINMKDFRPTEKVKEARELEQELNVNYYSKQKKEDLK